MKYNFNEIEAKWQKYWAENGTFHAVQHAKGYQWLQMRSKLVPIVSIASKFSQWVIYGGIALMAGQGIGLGQNILIIGLIMFATGTLFSFVTLPVEYDASNRALRWLKHKNMLSKKEQFLKM